MTKIKLEHFIYTSFDGIGYKRVGTPQLESIISRKSLAYLQSLSDSRQSYLPQENLVAITHVTPTRDSSGRRATFNHTILVPIEDYFNLHPPSIFKPHFIKHLNNHVTTLEPLVMKQ